MKHFVDVIRTRRWRIGSVEDLKLYGRINDVWKNSRFMEEFTVYGRIDDVWKNSRCMEELTMYGRIHG